jgi:protein-disulfide isomerase
MKTFRYAVAALACSAMLASAAFAQTAAKKATRHVVAKKTSSATTGAATGATTVVQDKASVLRPPAGAKVAIVVFQDLQCPDCARAHPLLEEAKKDYNVPLVQHDFPLPMHNWSFNAAVIGRYFDTKSKKLGDAWRDYCYTNQTAITPENLMPLAQKFAQANGTALPFLLDPDKSLEKKVKDDFSLGQKIGIQHTPTIFVVNNNRTAAEPFVEVVDRAQLSQIIENMKAKAK